MTHEEKDKMLAEQAAEKEALLQKLAEMEAMKAEAEAKAAEAETKAAVAGEKEAEAVAALEAMQKAAEEQAQANAKIKAASKTHPEKVEIELYKDENIKDDVQVFVNGRQYIIQRGVRVDVPWEVYVVLQNQQRMKKHIIAYNEKHEQK